jgi:hypothetical protein
MGTSSVFFKYAFQIRFERLKHNSGIDEETFFGKCLESCNESGRENEIRELLQEQEWIQQTVDILRDN